MERFLDYFKPAKYILELVVDKNKKSIGGKVTITGEALDEIVKLHAVRLEISDVLVNGEKAQFKANGEVLEIKNIVPGTSELTIYYSGKLNENMEGAYLSTYEYNGHTETIVATQFESHYAREAFPCVDEPEAKAVFELTIMVPDKDDVVLSNTPEAKVRFGAFRSAAARELAPAARGDGPAGRGDKPNFCSGDVRTVVFEPTPRMSTYLLAFVIGKFHGKSITNEHGVEITTYCALNQDVNTVDFANEIAAKSLEFYDDNFGVPYPLDKLDQVALPDFEAGAMENWGLVTYRESMLLAGESATLSTKKCVALTVAHELSHQWFGDLVTMKWWDDLWLNESFASVMEYYATDHIHPEYKIFESFFTGDCLAALRRDCLDGVQSVHQEVNDPAEIATLFDGAIVYAKGARLMLMLIRAMGWDNFMNGIKDYFVKFKYKNTVGDDLWTALEPYADFDPKALMHAFIDKPGYPVITNGKQKRFLIEKNGGSNNKNENWPLPKITEDMSGHYILNLSEAEFNERLGKFSKLSLEEKLRLLIDRGLLAKTEMVPSASLIPLLVKFKDETSASVWNIIIMLVANLKIFFTPESEEEKVFKNYLHDLVAPGLKKIGYFTKKDDDENTLRLRSCLVGINYFAEDLEMINALAKKWVPEYNTMNPEDRANIIETKIYLEPEIVDEYIKAYQKIADPEIKFELLFAGTLSRDEKTAKKMVKLLDKPNIVKLQDRMHLFIYLFRNPKVQNDVFEWMVKNWTAIKEIEGDKSIENYPRCTAGVIRTSEMYQKWLDFFKPLKNDSALKRAIEVGQKEIEARLKLINNDKKEVLKTLGI